MNNKLSKSKVAIAALFTLSIVVAACNATPSNENASDASTTTQPVSNMTETQASPSAMPPATAPAQEAPVSNATATSIKFAEMDHDFGQIKQETENKKIFKFTNTGKEPLLISNAVGSCGCTVPNYPKEPIAPGKTGQIEVIYKPGQQKGVQTKTVTITANTDPTTTVLNIKADVQEVKK